MRNLQLLGYEGAVYPVNPRHAEILGRTCYASLKDASDAAGQPIDAVCILLGRDAVLPVVEEAAAVGAKAIWAFASGFAESGDEGRRLQQELALLCRKEGIAFCGPNCVGVVDFVSKAALFSAPLPVHVEPGSVSVVSQSGSICLTLINGAPDLGFRTVVSSGNEAVLDSTDYIEAFLEDPETTVIAAFIEEFRDPQRFQEVAQRACALGTPIVVLKVGRSSIAQRATAAHTGALAGADAVYDAVFRRHGVVRVDDLDELVQACELFSRQGPRRPSGNRLGMLTLSGGAISLAADIAEELGLTFPDWKEETKAKLREILPEYAPVSNPLDAWGSGRIEDTYEDCLQAAAQDAMDVLIVALDAPPGISEAQREQFLVVAEASARIRQATNCPVIGLSQLSVGMDPMIRDAFHSGSIPVVQGTREGLRAVRALLSHQMIVPEAGVRAPQDRSGPFSALPAGLLDESESKKLLRAVGIPCVEERVCTAEDEVLAAACDLSYPVVIKGISARVPHKADHGLVALNVTDEKSARRAYSAVHEAMGKLSIPDPSVLVQTMVQGAVAEIFLSMSRDPSFGPYVVLGVGGSGVELLRETSLQLPPLQPREISEMLRSLLGGRLLSSPRGLQRGDIDALIDVALVMSDLAASVPPRIKAIEINPLLVLARGSGVLAVDALIDVAETPIHKESSS